MSKTYILTSTACKGGMSGVWDGSWNDFYFDNGGGPSNNRKCGMQNGYYRATYYIFDATKLTALRSKSILSVTLSISVTGGSGIPSGSSELYAIRFKRYNNTGSDSGSSTWQCTIPASNLSYINSDTGTTITFSSPVVPEFGYVLGPNSVNSNQKFLDLASTATLTVVTNEDEYTACGAPTSISFKRKDTVPEISIIEPGGNLTIAWSGASAGTGGNTITGYDVYYKIGSTPTTSVNGYDGYSSVSSTSSSASTSFTIPSTAARGSKFYAIIRTRGSAGSGYYSGYANGNGGVVNSLPGAPTVSVDKTRIKSTGGATTVTFTVVAGSDVDTGQTKTLYYATSPTEPETEFTSPLSKNLSAGETYYFWTYDGLEFSSSYTSRTITVNTPPTITSVTMSAYNNITYTPSSEGKLFVKNINCSETHTADAAATLTYSWNFATSSAVNGTYVDSAVFGNSSSYGNLDVTANGVSSFGKFYKLKLRITDDLGEYAESYAKSNGNDIIFCIPPAPTISSVINQKSSSNASNTNPLHFDSGMRFYYDPSNNNNGVTKELQYSTSNNFSSYNTINLSGIDYSDATLTALTRGTTYYFRIKMTCNSISEIVTIASGRTRALDITPTITAITPQSTSVVKPYTHSTIGFTFTHGSNLISWDTSQDVQAYSDSGDTPTGIYTIKLKYGNNSITVPLVANGENISSGVVNGSIVINSFTSTDWKNLIGSSNTPNSIYTLIFEVTTINGFGTSFIATYNFSVSFIEGFSSFGNAVLSIKTGTSTYINIPTNTYTSSNRYPLFESQTIRITISGLACYAEQNATIRLRQNNATGAILSSTTISTSEWNFTSPRTWALNTSKTIDYVIPAINSSSNITFYIEVVLSNGQTNNFNPLSSNICKYIRVQTSAIAPVISQVEETSSNVFSFTGTLSDYGGDGSGIKTGSYSSYSVRYVKCATSNGTYTDVGTSDFIPTTSDISQIGIDDTTSPLSNDILYFGLKVTLSLAFVTINGATPTGKKDLDVLVFPNLFTLYRATPNLLYGKNFFVLNQNSPTSGRTDQLIEFATTASRNKIYFNYDTNTSTSFQITSDGLVIDCGSW